MNEIIVGNIGSVYRGHDDDEAQYHFDEYKRQSESEHGRAGSEDVVWLQNDEIYKEFRGKLSQTNQD